MRRNYNLKQIPKYLDKRVVKSSSFSKYYQQVIKWLIRSFDLDSNLKEAGTPYLKFLNKVWKHRGCETMIKTAKAVRLYVTRHLSGQPLIIKTPGIQLTKDFLPKVIGPDLLRIVRKGDNREKRFLLTVLYSTRAITLPIKEDYSTIEAPYHSEKWGDYEILISDMKLYSRCFFRAFGLRKITKKENLHWKSFHQTTKSGPNGHALSCWWEDFKALPVSLKESLKIVGGPELSEHITLYDSLMKNSITLMSLDFLFGVKLKFKPIIRLISKIPDKEGKTRIIAIGDYWSQTSLYFFHKYLFKCLRRIKQDCTFNQGSFREFLSEHEGPFYSADLSAATDRFPIQVIKLVLKGHISPEIVDHWSNIMVGYDFNKSKHNNSKVSYAVGNPMGFYSSWASFAVAHHFVMFYCCQTTKLYRWKDCPYVLLGDDIVIGNKTLY